MEINAYLITYISFPNLGGSGERREEKGGSRILCRELISHSWKTTEPKLRGRALQMRMAEYTAEAMFPSCSKLASIIAVSSPCCLWKEVWGLI